MMTPQDADAFIEGVTEMGDAFAVLHALREKFGWSGTMFCPNDLSDYITNCREADDEAPLSPDALEEWVDDLMSTYEWNKGLTDHLTETGWELIGMAYEELRNEKNGAS
jgi:hypothetical protein